jgi:ABC-type transporter Mla maintaining outer membrane lipid asymmetry permease subunit MlaE
VISLPILVTAMVTAAAVPSASTNFISAMQISELVLGFAPIGILLTFLAVKGVKR